MLIERTVILEAFYYGLLGLGAFSFAFVGGKLFKFSEMLVERGIPFLSGIGVLLLMMPSFLVYVIPMSALLGILVTLSRMNADRELLVLKTSGMSPLRLLRAVFLISTSASSLTLFFTLYGVPWAVRTTQDFLFETAKKGIIPKIKENAFISLTPKVVLYVQKLEENDLKGVVIFDQRESGKTIVLLAEKGRLFADKDNLAFSIELEKGEAHIKEKKGYSVLRFERYSFSFSPSELIEEARKKSKFKLLEKEMSFKELREKIKERLKEGKDITPQLVELHLKWAIPFSPFPLGFLGLCLGLYRTRGGKALGFVLSTLTIVLYYGLYCLGKALSAASLLPPWSGAWLPNISLFILSFWLLRKIVYEKPVVFLDLLEKGLEVLKERR